MTITCPQCHHENPDDAEFCENCGAQLPVAAAVGMPATAGSFGVAPAAPTTAGNQLVCPNCKAPLVPGDEFCFNCGTDVRNITGGVAQPTVPAPAPVPSANGNGGSNSNNSGGMSDDEVMRRLAELEAGQGQSPATPPVSQVGPASQPAVVPPQTTPDPAVGNVSGGSIPAQPAANDPVAGNAFGMPPASTAPLYVSTAPTPAATGSSQGNLHLHINGPYGDQEVTWQDHEILLGRNDAKTRVFPDVNLDDSAASRRHLSIWKESADGLYYAQDLESANGTSLNGRDLRPGEPTELHDGDVLKIGTRYTIQVNIK